MPGLLYHAQHFHVHRIIGSDGKSHDEVIPTEDSYVISLSSWHDITRHCEGFGIPAEEWPEYETPYDVPLEEVRLKSDRIRAAVLQIAPQMDLNTPWLPELIACLRRGEQIIFSDF